MRIAVTGAAGRMGRTLIDFISASDDLTLGAAFERADSPQLGMDAGVLIMSRLEMNSVVSAISAVTDVRQKSTVVQDYHGGAVSRKVLNIILSYTDYINRTVWQKH